MHTLQLVKPSFCTFSCQAFRSAYLFWAVPPFHFRFASLEMSSRFVKRKSIVSFTPSPSTTILPVSMAWAHIHSSRRRIISRRSVKSSDIWITARCAGVLPLYRLSPGCRSRISSMVVTLSGAMNGGVYVSVVYPVFGIILPPISRDTNGASFRAPFL